MEVAPGIFRLELPMPFELKHVNVFLLRDGDAYTLIDTGHAYASGGGVYFDAEDHGSRNVQFANIVGGVKTVTSGTHILTFDSVSKDLVAAGTSAGSDGLRPRNWSLGKWPPR